ncbi:F-box/kelch-repeat protein At3g23880-like [Papaver somniferum]|uniref:F-box/kelch-repeat protein At3g23880-like n=1 Tax=Papaver somniferum TaxID=3469 RepID=UPI000E6FB101|nr:F-box/kelch-repeat protein At3g23880-like [Papaver somniferum]
MRRINFTPPFAYSSYIFLGSINGLVCLSEFHDTSVCICNPVTKEYVNIPKFSRESDSDQYKPWARGFGYLPLTNEYKFVESVRLKTDFSIVEVAVYTVGSGKGWRNVGRFDLKCGDTLIDHGVFVNGALSWVNKCGGMVYVLDLAEEKFREHISPPPKPPGWWHGYAIGVLGGVLYYATEHGYHLSESTSDIWLLKGKNDSQGTKEQVEQETLGWSYEFSYPEKKPFALVNGGVLYFHLWSLGIYDAVTSTSKELVRFSSVEQLLPHKNTLISLKELGEEDVKILG